MGVVRRIGVAAGAVFLAIALCYPLLAVEGSMSGAAHCFDAACGAAIDSLIIDEPCGCTKADYAVEYTPCNTTSDTRSAVHFWRPPATCRGGATPDLPEPIHDIPCGLVCGPGLHLFESSEGWFGCQVCEAGSFAPGGGVLFERPWRVVPAQLTAECIARNRECDAWRAQEGYLDSGDNTPYDGYHAVQSLLELEIELVVEGTIMFEYKYDAFNPQDPWNQFWFSDNGRSGMRLTESSDGWVWLNKTLAPGFHYLRWAFQKGRNPNGEDRAYIREIELRGLTYADLDCLPCPAGTYASAGAGRCSDCPSNTFSATDGAGECEDCKPWEHAFPGSRACIPSLPCNVSDMAVAKGPCVGGERTVSYSWLQPPACDMAGAVPLPPDTTEPCVAAPCPPGSEPASGGAAGCTLCGPDTYSPGDGVACVSCGTGKQTGDRTLVISNWDEAEAAVASYVETGCRGDCGSPSWRFGGSFVDSGAGHGPDTEVWLKFDADISKPATIEFDFVLSCVPGSARLEISVDNYVPSSEYSFECAPGCDTTVRHASLSLPAPIYEFQRYSRSIKWTYKKISQADGAYDHGCDRAQVFEVSVTGLTTEGGASSCTDCPAGSISHPALDACVECPAGQYAATPEECAPCNEGSYAPFSGATSCLTCPPGSQVASGGTACVSNCTFVDQSSGRSFDLGPLFTAGAAVGPVSFPRPDGRNGTRDIYLNICSGVAANYSCGGALAHGWAGAELSEENGINVIGNPRLNSLACLYKSETHEAVSLGSAVAFNGYSLNENGEPSIGVTLVDGSDGCGGGSDRRVTHIDFVCDHDYAVGAPVFVSTDSDDVCVTNLEWRTRHACPLCNKASYAELVSACVDGTQTHSWVLADALCVGGVQPELDSGAACDTTEVPINHIAVKPTTAIVGIVAAVVVVVGGCVVIYVQRRKHRRLYSEYSRLQQNLDDAEGESESTEDSIHGSDFAPVARRRSAGGSADGNSPAEEGSGDGADGSSPDNDL